MLKLNNVNLYYGVIHALKDISLEVEEGEIVTLIGANGAGKTSILRAISGLNPCKSGEIIFKGKSLNKVPAYKIVSRGISHVPEGRRVFSNLTVFENLQLGAYIRKDKTGIKKDYETIFNVFPILRERKEQPAGTLSGGEQQMLAIARALMVKPQLLLMDEPSMGLAPIIVQQIFNIIKEINEKGTTILLVEQNANMAFSIANKAYVLETGRIVLKGSAKELLANESVKSAYLG
ncbi:ABC transporter ATP-binding protein [Clostridium sp.]|jgi:branched-chain amino acid transport system ATP-binding protein|uniref:ABC transporter ATP-binding protein n=1 Tax=Clostridium sp. TaxID=1506 RepID=UPI002FDE0DF3